MGVCQHPKGPDGRRRLGFDEKSPFVARTRHLAAGTSRECLASLTERGGTEAFLVGVSDD